MTLKEAKKEAKRISQEEQCVQHVNCRIKELRPSKEADTEMDYYVSDWYNSDSTIVSFEFGNLKQ